MRLKHVFISHYKNLQDLSVDFDNDSFIDIFVGKMEVVNPTFLRRSLRFFVIYSNKNQRVNLNIKYVI